MNWFLIIVVGAVALLTMALSVYLIIIYQHPEDRNQAWFPKIVVLMGLCVAIWTVLLFPLDVANQQSCGIDLPLVDCSTTFPMKTIWEALYIANMILVFVLIPFALFYYEADSEWTAGKKWLSAILWTLGVMAVATCVIVIPWAFGGYAKYEIQGATSGILSVSYLRNGTSDLNECIAPLAARIGASVLDPFDGFLCSTSASGASEEWKVRVSLIVYAMSMIATLGWILFLVFGAIGLVALPLDWIRDFIGRPRSVISKAQYIERARDLARRARDIKTVAEALRRQERETGRSRKWRRNYAALQTQVVVLEEDQAQLETVFPQGEDPTYSWTVTVIMFWVKLFAGLISLAISITWVLQIILYILIDPPATPLLNDLFISAADIFPLFGTILFALFVFYLQLAVIKGSFRFGVNLLIFRIHPVRPGATVMSSLLFNVALILLASTAAIQFAASAFALYAQDTAILDIYGNTLRSLEGIRYIYTKNIYIYAFMVVILLTTAVMVFRGPDQWKRKKPEDVYSS